MVGARVTIICVSAFNVDEKFNENIRASIYVSVTVVNVKNEILTKNFRI